MQYDHFTFRSLMEDLPPLEYVDSTCFARDALKKMLASKCSQLPVLEKGKCIGVVTSESISRRLAQEAAQGNQATGFMNWPVTSFFDEHSPPLFVGPDEEIAEYAQTVGERGFALIGNPSRLKSLVTSGHLINFFMQF
jgi:CBS domain-containing protein